jgi:hypothetical protein
LDKASFQLCDIENMAIFSHPKKGKKKVAKFGGIFTFFLKNVSKNFPIF